MEKCRDCGFIARRDLRRVVRRTEGIILDDIVVEVELYGVVWG